MADILLFVDDRQKMSVAVHLIVFLVVVRLFLFGLFDRLVTCLFECLIARMIVFIVVRLFDCLIV